MGEVIAVDEDEKTRGEWKMSVVEGLVIGREGIEEQQSELLKTHSTLQASAKALYINWSFEAKEENTDNLICVRNRNTEIPTRKASSRNVALDSWCQSSVMLDS